jgi:hypothetical protein
MAQVKIHRHGEGDVWVDEAELNQPGIIAPPEPTYRELRAAAYRDELGKEQGDPVKTLGDVVDVIIAELAAIRSGAPATAAFSDMLPKIAAIKLRHPASAP